MTNPTNPHVIAGFAFCEHGQAGGCPRCIAGGWTPPPTPVTAGELAQLDRNNPPSDVAGVRWDSVDLCIRHAIVDAAAALAEGADPQRAGTVVHTSEATAITCPLCEDDTESPGPVLAVCEAEWSEALIVARELHAAGQSARRDAVAAVADDEAWIDVPRHVRRLAVAILRGHTTGEWDITPGSGRVPAPPAPPHGCVTADDTLDIIQRVLAGVLCHQDADQISPDTVSALVRSVQHLTAARSLLAAQTTEAGR